MINPDYKIKNQACNLSDALHRNINNNFRSVSFSICPNDKIQVKIVLNQRTKVEEDYIEDIIGEFEAVQESNLIRKLVIVLSEIDSTPLDVIVYLAAT